MTTCIGCGCEDDNACKGGCSWLAKSMSGRAGLCSSCGLGEIGAVTIDEAVEVCEEQELEWLADQASIEVDYEDAEPSLLLPGDPGFGETLRGMR
jgi:hypothetical protein